MGVMQPSAFEQILITTKVEKVMNWSRATSVWPVTFGLACCAIEMMAAGASRFDFDRFGAGIFRATPRQADLMIIAGTVTYKMAPVIKTLYDQMPEPKWVIAMGSCATAGGPFDSYHTIQGVDKIIPVDVFIPGCPPRPVQGHLRGGRLMTEPIIPQAPDVPEAPAGPYVYDYAASPQRQVVMPKTVPLPSYRTYLAEVQAAAEADEAKWKKMQADYETAKAKAEADGKDAPKPPVRPVPRKDDNDLKTPWPQEAKDADLLLLQELLGAPRGPAALPGP